MEALPPLFPDLNHVYYCNHDDDQSSNFNPNYDLFMKLNNSFLFLNLTKPQPLSGSKSAAVFRNIFLDGTDNNVAPMIGAADQKQLVCVFQQQTVHSTKVGADKPSSPAHNRSLTHFLIHNTLYTGATIIDTYVTGRLLSGRRVEVGHSVGVCVDSCSLQAQSQSADSQGV